MGNLIAHKTQEASIAVKVEGIEYEVFKIRFHHSKSTGNFSIIVSFPAFRKTTGIVSKLTLPANKKEIKKISLAKEGKVTSHLIKYSHWQDGNTHFSQDKKVFTSIKNLSNRLDEHYGHIFTIQLQGFRGFRIKDPSRKRNDEIKKDLDFNIENEIPTAIKFVARWYSASVVKVVNEPKDAIIGIKMDDGTIERGFVISPPNDYPLSDCFIHLSGKIIPQLTKEKGSFISFMGGFDPYEVWKDLSKDFHLLSFIYPVRGYKKLLNRIGSIDFQEPIAEINNES